MHADSHASYQCLQPDTYRGVEGRRCKEHRRLSGVKRWWAVSGVGQPSSTLSESLAHPALLHEHRRYNEKPHVSHDVLSLTYRDGSTCPADHAQKMESVIAFVCDHGVFGAGQPEFVTRLGDCHFFCELRRPADANYYMLMSPSLVVVWKTQHACSTSSKGIASGLGAVVTA